MSDSFDSSFYLPSSTYQDSTANDPDEKQRRISLQPEHLDTEYDQKDITKDDLSRDGLEYTPLNYHWFYDTYVADKQSWKAFSYKDSALLETVYMKNLNDIRTLRAKNEKSDRYIVQIKGGRFEVDLIDLINRPVYWTEKRVTCVRRCLWFYREETQKDFLPYEEEYSEFLEAKWEETIRKKAFHKLIHYSRISNDPKVTNEKEITNEKVLEKQSSEASNDELFVFHSENIMHHYTQGEMIDEFGNLSSDAKRPRIVRRGVEESLIIEQDEIDPIDHVCFVVHGIGEGCDLKFRPIVECVDNIRQIGEFLTESYLKPHMTESQLSGRVEFIPISWYHDLHGESTGIDDRLKPITLPSIPKLRQYSNSTILDVLFYTSPIYCQRIISKVGNELNRLSKLFLDRNPDFKGKISLIGHSLGSVIIFDLLTHQIEKKVNESPLKQSFISNETLEQFLTRLNLAEYMSLFEKEKITLKSLILLSEPDLVQIGLPLGPRRLIMDELNKKLANEEAEDIDRKIKASLDSFQADSNGSIGLAGTGQLMIKYPQLNFKINNFFALGSPIGAFITVRGIEKLGTEFKLPICDNFFNIFHPFDPIAYRCEPLIDSQIATKPPVLIPHHKGRKRMHLELKENLTKVSEDLKQRMYGQFRTAWTSITEMAKLPSISSNAAITTTTTTASNTTATTPNEQIQIQSIQMTQAQVIQSEKEQTSVHETQPMVTESIMHTKQEEEEKESKRDVKKFNLGKLNNGRRVDYVLQESPFESFNEYLFALHAHACYWESEDTVLLMLKEIYNLQETNDEEITLNEQQQQSSWLAQTAAATISSNVQKTFSYFNIGLPPTLSSVLTPSFSNLKALTASNKSTQK